MQVEMMRPTQYQELLSALHCSLLAVLCWVYGTEFVPSLELYLMP